MINTSDLISQKLFSRLCFISIAVVLESTAFASGKPAATKRQESNWYASNQALFDAGKYNEVVKNLETLKLKGPQEARRRFLLARTYAKLKRYNDAANFASQALAIDPNMLPAKFNEACYLTLAGQLQGAADALRALEGLSQTRPEKERKSTGQAIKTDPDLESLRKNPRYQKLVEDIAQSLISNTERLVPFEGCALKDKTGKIVEVKYYDCQGFDGAIFSGPADSCGGWLKIKEVVPLHMTQNLEECIYEL